MKRFLNLAKLIVLLIFYSLLSCRERIDNYNPPNGNDGTCKPISTSLCSYVSRLIISPTDAIFAATRGGVIYSGKYDWCSFGLTNQTVQSLSIDTNHVLFASSPDSGIKISRDGIRWKSCNNNIRDINITLLDRDADGSVIAGTFRGDLYASIPNADTYFWYFIHNFDSASVNAITLNDSGHYFIGTNMGLYISKNSGITWNKQGDENKNIRFLNFYGHRLIMGGNAGFFYSNNNGLTWLNTLTGDVKGLQIHSDGTIFGCTENGLYRSNDSTNTWETISAGIISNPSCMLIDKHGNLIVGTSGSGIFISTNNGNTWIQTLSPK